MQNKRNSAYKNHIKICIIPLNSWLNYINYPGLPYIYRINQFSELSFYLPKNLYFPQLRGWMVFAAFIAAFNIFLNWKLGFLSLMFYIYNKNIFEGQGNTIYRYFMWGWILPYSLYSWYNKNALISAH